MDQEALLKQFIGRWRGEGRGEYPTIESFTYSEELTIISTHMPTVLQYETRTIKTLADGTRAPSHKELGFIRLRADGSVEWSDVQSSGRIEVLHGAMQETENALVVALNQTLLGNDARMKDSARVYRVSGDQLEYRQEMALVTVPDLQFHTSATLHRMPLMMT